jgi:hypothetical protein
MPAAVVWLSSLGSWYYSLQVLLQPVAVVDSVVRAGAVARAGAVVAAAVAAMTEAAGQGGSLTGTTELAGGEQSLHHQHCAPSKGASAGVADIHVLGKEKRAHEQPSLLVAGLVGILL